jgi:hypothetical protein
VTLQKYCPFEINHYLKNLKYKKIPESKLNKEQLRELRGFFKDQKYEYDLRNLIPFELWKGEAEVNVPQSNVVRILEQITYLSISNRIPAVNMFSLAPAPKKPYEDEFPFPNAITINAKLSSDQEPYEVWINSDQFDPTIRVKNEEYKSIYASVTQGS